MLPKVKPPRGVDGKKFLDICKTVIDMLGARIVGVCNKKDDMSSDPEHPTNLV
jgi:hypothetical protein